jgi:ketosteroid isomerase-like protein
MSRENVELVRQLQVAPDVDLTDVFMRGDEAGAESAIAAISPQFTDDFVCVFHGLSRDPRPGVKGLREAWLDWLEPWETYRVEIERISDAGDRVLVFSRDFGRRPGMEEEVELKGSAVWTVRDGKVARAEFFTDRAKALEAADPRK